MILDPKKDKSPEEIIEEELESLDQDIRQLKVRFDQFFYGNQKLPPTMLRSQVDRTIRKYANISMRSFIHRYRFNNLLIKYQAYTELWSRRMRVYEEGERPSVAARSQPEIHGEELVARARVSDPQAESERLREIYEKFVAARSERDSKKKAISFDKFVRGVAGQAAELRKTSGCAEIELRLVVKDDQVQLKARPGD